MTSSVLASIVVNTTTPLVTSDTASASSTPTECYSVEEVVVIHDQPEEEGEEGIQLPLRNFEPNSNYCLR